MTARRLREIEESATLRISNIANELKGQGRDVISFSLGEPDFPTPKHICEAAKEALDRGETHYTPSPGIPELRQAIAEKLKIENRLEAKANNILVTPGAKQAIFEALLAVLDEGDEAILFDPAWVSYEPAIRLAGARVVWAPVNPKDFTPLDPIELITSKTKIIVVNSPCNPTGAVFDKKNLKAIADLAKDHDFLVLSDEIYEKIIYDKEHISIGSLDGMEERTITINGFSKAYAMTGWRLGYAAAPKNIFEQMLKLHSHSVSQAGSFVQYGGLAALRRDQGFILNMVKEFRARRDLLIRGLNKLGLRCNLPEGAFYAFPNVGKYGDGESFSEMLLTKAQVATTPGSAFGPTDTNYIRISYATSRERIREALRRIEGVLG